MTIDKKIFDVFIIGGGVNGCGIARDLSGRGLSVMLAEMSDLGGATSSASTKLFHGGLRYLEYFKFRLVREALVEREILLQAMPHISKPMRFILPYHKDMRFEGATPTSNLLNIFMPWMKGRRPLWLIRLGLFIYDHMGGRKILPATSKVDLTNELAEKPLKEKFETAYEYSDCWVQDSRLVILNARDAKRLGARIRNYTEVVSAHRDGEIWKIVIQSSISGKTETIYAKGLINASGPWVKNVIKNVTHIQSNESVRLVRGSHIVVKKIYEHDKAYFLQGEDGRIVFAIPYEEKFTLIGTTDIEYDQAPEPVECTDHEANYLIDFVNRYFKKPVNKRDIVWSYSGLRPLYEDNVKSATAATRDYVLSLDKDQGAPLLNIFGGKITTYRRLAEAAFEKIALFYPNAGQKWTAGVPLSGGDFPIDGVESLIQKAQNDFMFLDYAWAKRLVTCYGTDVWEIFQGKQSIEDLGLNFGANLTETEVVWLIKNEFVLMAEDILWRRTKVGLHMTEAQMNDFQKWMMGQQPKQINNLGAK